MGLRPRLACGSSPRVIFTLMLETALFISHPMRTCSRSCAPFAPNLAGDLGLTATRWSWVRLSSSIAARPYPP
jgi:hypothetical protein